MVQNSFIGTDINGQKKIANSVGIEISNSSANTVGSTFFSDGDTFSNLISGNAGDGIEVMTTNASVPGRE